MKQKCKKEKNLKINETNAIVYALKEMDECRYE